MSQLPLFSNLPHSTDSFGAALDAARESATLIGPYDSPDPTANALYCRSATLPANHVPTSPQAVINRERTMMQQWKQQDLATFYRHQSSNRYR